MSIALFLILFSLTTLVYADSPPCPAGMFEINEGDRCEPEYCPGECFDIFTCCANLCFPRNMTSALVESCGIQEETSLKSCSKHLEEMSCISNITNSTPAICHEQIIWMAREGHVTFAPDDIENCPCERNYTLLESYCNFDVCRKTTDCLNTTDTFYNTNVCCYSNSLNPTEDVCDDGYEVVTIIQSPDPDKCNETCYNQGATCRTSNVTFSACCRMKPLKSATNEDKNSIQIAADGFVVALIVTFILIFVSGCVTVGICIYRRKFLKRHTDDTTRVLGIGSIEEDINDQEDWTKISGNDDINHVIVEEDEHDLQEDTEESSIGTTVLYNQHEFYREVDTPPMEDHRLSSDESNELHDGNCLDYNDNNHVIKLPKTNHVDGNGNKSRQVSDQKHNSVAIVRVMQKGNTDPNFQTPSSLSEIVSRKRKLSLAGQTIDGDMPNFVIGDIKAVPLDYRIKETNDSNDEEEIIITKPIDKNLQDTKVDRHRGTYKNRFKSRRHSTDENSKQGNFANRKVLATDKEDEISETQQPSDLLRRSATAPNIRTIQKVRNAERHKGVIKRSEDLNEFQIELETYRPIKTVEEESDDSGVLNSSFSSSSGINIAAYASQEFGQTRNQRPLTPHSAAIGGQQKIDFTHID